MGVSPTPSTEVIGSICCIAAIIMSQVCYSLGSLTCICNYEKNGQGKHGVIKTKRQSNNYTLPKIPKIARKITKFFIKQQENCSKYVNKYNPKMLSMPLT